MKVLFLTNVPAPYRVAFFNELGKLCQLTVAFCGKSSSDRNTTWQSETINRFTPLWLQGWQLKAGHFLCPRIHKLFTQHWDKIILGGYGSPTYMLAIEYMHLHKIPFFLEVDGGLIRADSKLKFWLKKHFISAADGWFSSGKETTKYLTYYGANPAKIYQYPFSSLSAADISLEVSSPQQKKDIRNKLGITENQVMVSVGQFIPRKGYDLLLRAAANLPKEIGIYIIGDNPTAQYLALQKELNLTQVHFVGFQTKETLKKWYQAADVFVLPTREDIWGLVINEAMAQGLPVITTNTCVAGLELVKEGKNGYITPVENVEQLAQAITNIFAQDYRAMGQKSLEFIKPYNIENMAQVHYQTFLKSART